MTLDEFRLLKEGDKIEGMTGNVGTVSRVDESRNSRGRSVAIEWGHNVTPFSFNEHMTAWMHWTKIEPDCKAAGRCLGSNPDDCFELSKCAKTESVAQVSVHDSDCAMFNRPAFPASRCDCSANKSVQSEDDANGERTG